MCAEEREGRFVCAGRVVHVTTNPTRSRLFKSPLQVYCGFRPELKSRLFTSNPTNQAAWGLVEAGQERTNDSLHSYLHCLRVVHLQAPHVLGAHLVHAVRARLVLRVSAFLLALYCQENRLMLSDRQQVNDETDGPGSHVKTPAGMGKGRPQI